MDAVIAKEIDKARLSFIGWGQEKPVADNRSEVGRAKNRRVEIVKNKNKLISTAENTFRI